MMTAGGNDMRYRGYRIVLALAAIGLSSVSGLPALAADPEIDSC